MLYDTMVESINAVFEDARVEGFAVGKAEGLAEAFRQFLAPSDRNIWPGVSDVMNWIG